MTPLATAAELNRLLGAVTVLDVRYRLGGPPGRAEHAAGHIPGAAYVDLDTELAAPPGPGGRHPLPAPDAFGAAMRRAGVRSGRPVVVYDDWGGRAAARCWWLLRLHGHPDVRVLDGGWGAWQRAGGAVAVGAELPGAGDFAPVPPGAGSGPAAVLEIEGVLAHAEEAVLVDARDPARFRGEVEPVDPVAGHIPGAVNVPTSTNLGAEGTFRPAAEIAALYAAAGADGERPVAVYCGSGVTAAHNVLALATAGIEAALYPGSWSEWVYDGSRPVETGGS